MFPWRARSNRRQPLSHVRGSESASEPRSEPRPLGSVRHWLLPLFCAAALSAQQAPVFRADVDLVRVRNQTNGRPVLCLDYECYRPMALAMMAKIGHEIAAAHQVTRVAMVHRLGRLLIGETSVAVIATAPHRRAAFEAALEGIDRLKKTVPIWKKEHFRDGEVWVEGEWDRNVPVAG